MTSLSKVYAGGVGTVASRRRRLLGTALFVVGAALVVAAIPLATTNLRTELSLGVYEARELAGVLAGLGLPAVFVGIFTVLPAGRPTRAAAAIGASIAVLGVAVFAVVYPDDWIGSEPTLAVATVVVYATGTLVTFWCLFLGAATFKTRNEPGGTARIEITDEGTVRVITEESETIPGLGGVGLFGSEPDGNVETHTNLEDTDAGSAAGGTDRRSSHDPRSADGVTAASDGAGAVHPDDGTPQDSRPSEVREAVRERGRPDEYCGNCSHFRYVRAEGTMAPYCGLDGELMEDMDACDEWEPNG
jgi:hypothetical protein